MFEWLFDTSPYVPRMNCGEWPTWLVILAVSSNAIIAFSYMVIPFFLWYFWNKKHKEMPHSSILIKFVLFIFFCGTTHIMDALTFFWPAYRLLTLTDGITAFVSFTTVLSLPDVVTHFLNFKTPGEYRQIAEVIEKELRYEREMAEDLDRIIKMLEGRIERMEREIQRKGWLDEQNLRLDELRETLDDLKGKHAVRITARTSG